MFGEGGGCWYRSLRLRIVSCNSTCRTAEFVERQEQGFGEVNRYKIKGEGRINSFCPPFPHRLQSPNSRGLYVEPLQYSVVFTPDEKNPAEEVACAAAAIFLQSRRADLRSPRMMAYLQY